MRRHDRFTLCLNKSGTGRNQETQVLNLPANPEPRLILERREVAAGAPGKDSMRSIWLVLAFLFLIGWLIAFVAFHVVFAAIHILLGLFVLFIIIHFARNASRHA